MKATYLFISLLAVGFVSCKKDKNPVPAPPPGDVVTVKLKDMTIRNLPGPYYQFEYDNTGLITRAGFSGGIRLYDVSYTGKNIEKMEDKSAVNRDKLQYEYVNGDIAVIKVINSNGVVYRRCFLSYTPARRLQKLDWEVKEGSAGFAMEQTLEFSYYTDGNLRQLVNHLYPVGSQLENTHIDKFENYDNKVNADGFSLLHTDNHHLLLLPKFKLQVNNPRKVTRTGTGTNYVVDYTYSYDGAGRPLVKTGDVLFTSGPNNGQHFESLVTYSYYN